MPRGTNNLVSLLNHIFKIAVLLFTDEVEIFSLVEFRPGVGGPGRW